MNDEQTKAEALDDDKFDDLEEVAPDVALVDNTADADGAVELDAGETGDSVEGHLAESERDPAPNVDGAEVAPEEAAMHVVDPS
jgi:hypothetical protein